MSLTKKNTVHNAYLMGHLAIPQCNANHFKMHIILLLSKTTHKSKCTNTTPSLSNQRGGDMK